MTADVDRAEARTGNGGGGGVLVLQSVATVSWGTLAASGTADDGGGRAGVAAALEARPSHEVVGETESRREGGRSGFSPGCSEVRGRLVEPPAGRSGCWRGGTAEGEGRPVKGASDGARRRSLDHARLLAGKHNTSGTILISRLRYFPPFWKFYADIHPRLFYVRYVFLPSFWAVAAKATAGARKTTSAVATTLVRKDI